MPITAEPLGLKASVHCLFMTKKLQESRKTGGEKRASNLTCCGGLGAYRDFWGGTGGGAGCVGVSTGTTDGGGGGGG